MKGINRIIKKIYLIIVKKLYIVVIRFVLVIVIKIYQKKTNNKNVPILKKYHGITKIIFFLNLKQFKHNKLELKAYYKLL